MKSRFQRVAAVLIILLILLLALNRLILQPLRRTPQFARTFIEGADTYAGDSTPWDVSGRPEIPG